MSISEQLIALNDAKQDIKNALVEKGVTPTGGLSTYADAVREVSGGWYPNNGICFCKSTCKTIPLFDTTNITSMYQMFRDCGQLTSIPPLETGNVTDMGEFCMYCFELQSVPLLNTSNVTNMNGMFFNCTTLPDIPLMDASKVRTIVSFAMGSYGLTNIGGFINLGKCQFELDEENVYWKLTTDNAFKGCRKITRESVLNIFNNLYDVTGSNNIPTLSFETEVIARLKDEDIIIATNKGWVISSY